ncbi:lysozyme inhibitor LprI family protein [Trinickia sp.]|uniref:lysozyme inhibitor LprI family protein n=1 Tax=Trinickia sp. TaxID=2571163 RepID=UPI003F7FE955
MGPFAVAASAVLLASISTSTFAQNADIDCAKPHAPVERAICANAALRSLDARANAYYSMLLEAKPAADNLPYREFRDGLQADEQKWRHDTRDACGPQVSCLSEAYQHRIDDLRTSASEHLGLVSAPAGPTHDAGPAQPAIDYKDAIYRIGESDVTLLGGQHAQPAAPDSSAQEVTRVVEPPEHGAGSLGGRPAVALFLSQDSGGSGTFYYAAVVFPDGRGTTFQIGDRIQPIKIAINGDDLAVTYLDRKPDEPMAVPPTVPRDRHFAYMNDRLVERPQAATAAK